MSPVERDADGELVWDTSKDPREECVVMDLDGEPLVVRGSGDWTPRERELFASLARAAREMALRERSEDPVSEQETARRRGEESYRAMVGRRFPLQVREVQPDVETDQ